MLLPEACKDASLRQFLLALDPSGISIVGALSFRDTGKVIGSVRLHVIGARRRRGLGSSLLGYAADEARRLGRERVIADVDLHRETEAEPLLTANGFARISRMTTVEGLVGAVITQWKAARERTPPLHQLSPDARIVRIDEAPIQQLVKLYAEYIGEMPVVTGLERTWRLDQYRESVVLMVGDQVIGVMLAVIEERVLVIPAWIVAPEYRGQLAGLQLRTALLNRMEARLNEVDRIHFDFLDKAAATAKLAQKSDYKVIALTARFERVIA